MTDAAPLIQDVSDTALWVAYYRAEESKRKDALFKDPLANVLIGDRGKKIADSMKNISKNIAWSVVLRTLAIDAFIEKLLKEGVDTILNLGAGMDTRPYRMNLPATLKWIEVDFDHSISYKNKLLQNETANCALSRISLDLSNDQKRKAFLQEIGAQSKKIAVLTEGVIPYLTEKQVADLANDLYNTPSIVYWITEYMSPQVYPYLQSADRVKKMKNAPFQFFPKDWMGFFKDSGWIQKEITYHGETGVRVGRPMPMPARAILFKLFAPKALQESVIRSTGFLLLEKAK
ncbi:MAG TPA: SAM-dependent methyltransferase [Bacteroidia bacterium]|jgi:methyltransferase (TIGR00027 family)|nr:SAM-dependent methyltransferase [Bacteroidia bacterium]